MTSIDWTDPVAVAELLVQNAIAEDHALADEASGALAEYGALSVTCFVNTRESVVAAGISLSATVFSQLPGNAVVESSVEEGEHVDAGRRLAVIRGTAEAVLRGERIFLNILGRLCGIASETSRFVRECRGTGVEILDTRKTTPGMRALEKYAVRTGGGVNHRFSLADMAMLKDNHIAAAGGVENLASVMKRLSKRGVQVEIEVDSLQQLRAVVPLQPDRILLDNMTVGQMREAVILAGGSGIYLEASGGITLETVRAAAETGVDGISVGMLTHSVKSSDIGLDWHYSKENK
jgi:nicotinate-nucleotide pyrophosphorylase (carboxylating)